MAAPGKNKLKNSQEDGYFETLINDDDDDLLFEASRNFESNDDENNKEGEKNQQTGPNSKEKNINKTTNEDTNNDKTTTEGQCIIEITTKETRANNDALSGSGEIYTCTPLTIYRPKYLCVTDLTQQDWCEQQLFCKLTMPLMITVPTDEQPVVAKGAIIHTERELEVHDVINIKTTSMADRWGIKFLNLLTSVLGFLNGITVAREIPILGVPFNEDAMVFGIIDELRFDPDNYTIDLSELKTKLSRKTSSKAQRRQHSLQVMMYKKLFDDAVKGRLSKVHIQKHLNLDLSKEFGDDLKGQIVGKFLDCKNLSELLDILLQRIQCLTCIGQIHLEYVHQESGETISIQEITYDENQLCNFYSNCLKFWKGQRSPVGIDIEEAWKCQNCDFESVCEWRMKKAEECRQRNIKKNNLKGN